MSAEISQIAELLARVQEKQAKAGSADLSAFEGLLTEISNALSEMVGLMESGGKAHAAREKAEDARRRAANEVLAESLATALADAMGKLRVESKPEVKVAAPNLTVQSMKVPGITVPSATVQRVDVTAQIDVSKMPVPQVTLLPPPPNPPCVHRIEIERDHNGFVKAMTVARIPGRR